MADTRADAMHNGKKHVIVLMHDGFEEIEAVAPIDICRRADVTVTVCSMTKSRAVTGSKGIVITADTVYDELTQSDMNNSDALILPGGMPNSRTLRDDKRVIDAVRRFYEAGKLVCAICAAPIVLERAGIIKGRRVTSYPSALEDERACEYVDDRVAVSGNIITSRGAGTAVEFALAILKELGLAKKAESISKGILHFGG